MKRKNYFYLLIILIFLSSCSNNQQVNEPVLPSVQKFESQKIEKTQEIKQNQQIDKQEVSIVNNFIKSDIVKHSNLSFYAIDLDSGDVIGNYRGEISLVPASVMKVVTSATALEVLGPDATLETKLIADGNIKNKMLTGNLYIQGGGDPTLGSDRVSIDREAFLKEWVNSLKKAGINTVSGDIIVLDDLFGYEGVPGNWLWEDMGTGYAPGTYGISIFDNIYTLYLTSGAPGTTPKITKISPNIQGLSLDNQSKASFKNKKDIYVRGIPLDKKRRVFGEVPSNKTGIALKSDIPDPGLFLGQYFFDYLKKNGITVKGKVTTARLTSRRPKNPRVIAVTKSVPMTEIVKILLTRSDNHYTESLYQILEKSQNINISEFWKEKGIDVESLIMRDGSGLSRSDIVSSKLLVDILDYMNKNFDRESQVKFEELFPVAGVNGTVAGFLKNTPLEGKARVKSGSMSGIQSYTGYVENNGKKYAFAVIVNHWSGNRSELKAELEKLLNNLFK